MLGLRSNRRLSREAENSSTVRHLSTALASFQYVLPEPVLTGDPAQRRRRAVVAALLETLKQLYPYILYHETKEQLEELWPLVVELIESPEHCANLRTESQALGGLYRSVEGSLDRFMVQLLFGLVGGLMLLVTFIAVCFVSGLSIASGGFPLLVFFGAFFSLLPRFIASREEPFLTGIDTLLSHAHYANEVQRLSTEIQYRRSLASTQLGVLADRLLGQVKHEYQKGELRAARVDYLSRVLEATTALLRNPTAKCFEKLAQTAHDTPVFGFQRATLARWGGAFIFLMGMALAGITLPSMPFVIMGGGILLMGLSAWKRAPWTRWHVRPNPLCECVEPMRSCVDEKLYAPSSFFKKRFLGPEKETLTASACDDIETLHEVELGTWSVQNN